MSTKRSQVQVPDDYKINQEEAGGASLPWDPVTKGVGDTMQGVKDWWSNTGVGDWWERNVMDTPEPIGGWFQPGKAPVMQTAPGEAGAPAGDPLAGANIPTLETAQNIVNNPAVRDQVATIAAGIETPGMLSKTLSVKPGIGVSSTGEWVDWDMVVNYLLTLNEFNLKPLVGGNPAIIPGTSNVPAGYATGRVAQATAPAWGSYPVNPDDKTVMQGSPPPPPPEPAPEPAPVEAPTPRKVFPEFQQTSWQDVGDPVSYAVEQLTKYPQWLQTVVDGIGFDPVNRVKEAITPMISGWNINPDTVDWPSMATEVLALMGISITNTTAMGSPGAEEATGNMRAAELLRRAAFTAAEYLMGRKVLHRRRAADSTQGSIEEWGRYLQASKSTFTDADYAYYSQVLSEARDAFRSGDPRVALALVGEVRKAFELEAKDWDPSLFQNDPTDLSLQEVGADPQMQEDAQWQQFGTGNVPGQMIDPNMFDPASLGAQNPTPEQLQSEEYWNSLGQGPKPMNMVEDQWLDPATLQGAPGAGTQGDWFDETSPVPMPTGDVPRKLFSRLVARFIGLGVEAPEDEDPKLAKFTPPNYDLVLGDMVKAEEDGLDTFPRLYAHIEKNYILKRVATCSENSWLPHLVNDGFAINRMGINRGRGYRGASTLPFGVTAQTSELFDEPEFQKGEDQEFLENDMYQDPAKYEDQNLGTITITIDTDRNGTPNSIDLETDPETAAKVGPFNDEEWRRRHMDSSMYLDFATHLEDGRTGADLLKIVMGTFPTAELDADPEDVEMLKYCKKYLLSVDYENWSEEDFEAGGTDDRGSEKENDENSLDELIDQLRMYDIVDNANNGKGSWYSQSASTDIRTGVETSYYAHVTNIDGSELSPEEIAAIDKLL